MSEAKRPSHYWCDCPPTPLEADVPYSGLRKRGLLQKHSRQHATKTQCWSSCKDPPFPTPTFLPAPALWCSPVPALPMGTRLGTGGHAAGGRRPPGGSWAGPRAHCDMGPAWVPGGLFPAEQPKHLRREARIILSLLAITDRLALRCASLRQSPAAAGRWKGHPVARAAV